MPSDTRISIAFNSCLALVSCPKCGEAFPLASLEDAVAGNCHRCNLALRRRGKILEWQDVPAKVKVEPTSSSFVKRITQYLNPLTNPFSPLPLLTRARVEGFYQRTLADRELAAGWAAHYLKGLDLQPGATVLDHGCGRGRNIGLLNQLGYQVCGQETGRAHEWWQQFSKNYFQVVPPIFSKLPWKDLSFDLVLDVMVIHHLTADQLEQHVSEVFRVLRPGKYWLLLEANSTGYGADVTRRHYGRLHTLGAVRDLTTHNGFKELDCSFESFYAPIFPIFINFIRKQCAPWPMDISDYNSLLAKCLPAARRGLWLMRLQKGQG